MYRDKPVSPFYTYGVTIFRLSEVVRASQDSEGGHAIIAFRSGEKVTWTKPWPDKDWEDFTEALKAHG